MRSYTVFEDLGRDHGRLERPGYGQKQVAEDLNFARELLQAEWHPGWLKNRRGFAFSPHFPRPHDFTPPVRFWTGGKTAENMPISIRIVSRRDDFPCGVGPHLGARRKRRTTIGPYFEAWTKVQPYTASTVSIRVWYGETPLVVVGPR